MSGSISPNVLDALAHPAQVNLLDDYKGASQAAQGIWANRASQANALRGQLIQQATGPDGTVDMPTFNRLASQAGPAYAPAAAEGLDQSTKIAGEQQGQALKSLTAQSIALDSLGTGASFQQIQAKLDEGLKAGWLQPAGAHAVLMGMPQGDDPQSQATRAHILQTIGDQVRTASERLQSQYGAGGTVTGPDGSQLGTRQDPRTHAVSVPPQAGAPQGPSPDTSAGVSTITNPDGSTSTDTLAGHMKAGRVSPTGAPMPGYSAAAASPAMVTALRGQEGTPDGRTSSAGARGQMQVTPGFFKQYAQPGESFDSKADVEAVAKRGIAALEAKYPGDPGRVSTAYFSGEGNVAPKGSQNPWIEDKSDGTTKTSAYVAGATGRYKTAQQGQGGGQQPAAPGPKSGGTTVQPGTVEQNKIDQGQYNERTAAYNNNDANLIANYKEAYSLGSKIATGKGLENLSAARSAIVSLGRAFGYDTGKMDTGDQARAELDKVLNQILISQPGASGSDAKLGTTAAASPHIGMNTNAMLNQIKILYGQAKQQNAAMLEHDPATKGVGFQEHNRTMMSSTARDGFSADLMTPDEIDARVKRLGPDSPAAKAFKAGVVKNMALYHDAPGSGLGS